MVILHSISNRIVFSILSIRAWFDDHVASRIYIITWKTILCMEKSFKQKKQFIPNSAYCLLTNKTVDFVLLILKYVI